MSDQTQAQAQKPEVPAVDTTSDNLGTLMKELELDPTAVTSKAKRVIDTLKPEAQAKAKELAPKVTWKNTDVLLDMAGRLNEKLSGVSNVMIGDTKMGDIEQFGAIFSDFADLDKQIDVSKVNLPKPWYVQAFPNWKWLQRQFDRIRQLLERYEKVKPFLAKKKLETAKHEMASASSIVQCKNLYQVTIEQFGDYEIAIAAGELAFEREWESYKADYNAMKDPSMQELAGMKARRMALMRFDNRLFRLQRTRFDTIGDLELINLKIQNEEQLKDTLHEIREVVIPGLERSVAIAIEIYRGRQRAAFSNKMDEMGHKTRMANAEAMGHFQQEVHDVATKSAREVDRSIEFMEKMSALIVQGTTLMKETEKLNADARVKLAEGEAKFKAALEADLKEASSFEADFAAITKK